MLWLGPQDMLPGSVVVVGSVVIGFDVGRKWWIDAPPEVEIKKYKPGMAADKVKAMCEGKNGKRCERNRK